jgi:response regulator RpfG family c-di-GMP phosphodiesterase
MGGRFQRRPALLIAALVAVCAGAGLQLSGLLAGLERTSVAARFQFRHEPPPEGIAIVAIDDATFSDLKTRWPFRRSLHARVVDRLHAAGAKVIVYDVQFTEPTRPSEDLALYDALGRTGGAVLATTEVDSHGHTDVLGGDDNLAAVHSVAASTSLPVDPNGVKSRFRLTEAGLRTLAVVAAQRAGGPRLTGSDFGARGAWIDYRGPAGTFPTVSFSKVLRGNFDPALFRGKIVIVGATAPSLQDVHATPTGSEPMPGPEVEANAAWTALHGLPLRSAPAAVDLLIVLLLAALPMLLVFRVRIVAATLTALAAGAAYAVVTQIAFDGGTVLAVAAPLAGLATGIVAAMTASHLAESSERRDSTARAERLEIEVRARTAELRDTQLEIVRRLAQAADSRDEQTGEHIDRIGRLCESLALAVGLDEAEAETLRHASAMHDVGKIGIPDRVLLKPGKLDPDEWELMKTHTTLGAAILGGSRYPLLQLAETIALTHHERWDGSGYPEGLAGEEIPLEGRICAVCDVYDALTSERPYKSAWSREDALAEIARVAGSHFDPRLASAFVLLQTGRADAERDELARWSPRAGAGLDIRPR